MGRESVTMLRIAAKAGVSRSTVSLALQGSGLIRPRPATRWPKLPVHLGYVYNRGAANLRRARSNIVGMVINDLTNPFFAELAVGIERGPAVRRATFRSSPTRARIRSARPRSIRSMREQGMAGLIICPARGTTPDAFEQLLAAGIPVILAMRRLAGQPGFDRRRPTIAAGPALAVAHLVSLGHRRIAFPGGFGEMSVHAERAPAIATAWQTAGSPADPGLMFEGPPTRDSGAAMRRSDHRRSDPATALVLQRRRGARRLQRPAAPRSRSRARFRRGRLRRHQRGRPCRSAADHGRGRSAASASGPRRCCCAR